MTIGYIAYIDESGDDGIKRVRPIDEMGASEWFVLGAFVIEKQDEVHVARWVREIIAKFKSHQRRDIHFTKLDHERRRIACKALAELPGRCFVAITNKQNMRGYRNPRAEWVRSKNYFYNWMTRLLLEKVTRHCYSHSLRKHKKALTLRLEFSSRGGMSYSHLRGYLHKMREQSHTTGLHIETDDLSWPVIDLDEIASYDHRNRAGVQLADIVSGAFYQALGEYNGVPGDPQFAMLLEPKMAKSKDGNCFGFGVKFMPRYETAKLADHQRRIFEFYGAPKKSGRPPAPRTPAADRPPSKG